MKFSDWVLFLTGVLFMGITVYIIFAEVKF